MARNAGLCWFNTPLPIRQVNLVPPNQPVHSPFVNFVPKELAIEESSTQIASNDASQVESGTDDVAQEPSSSSVSGSSTTLAAAPFKLGPTPALVRTVVPFGETKSMYPRGNTLNCTRTDPKSVYSGPDCYQWNPIVSILNG